MKTAGINGEMAMDATNLTQLSSREQLSALMDGALPADETRFLLRRLQHDASLAESWERWRLSAEVMRGLAPAQRLPADFASRVSASLRGEEEHVVSMTERAAISGRHVRTPAWLRWGGGAAVAASLAVVALMNQPTSGEFSGASAVAVSGMTPSIPIDVVASAKAPVPGSPAPRVPSQAPTGTDLGSQAAALASAIAVAARPARAGSRGVASQPGVAMPSGPALMTDNVGQPSDAGTPSARNILPLLPQPDIITRPWPRSVLPHAGYADLTVGFGDSPRDTPAQNPFQQRSAITNMPPALIMEPLPRDAPTPAGSGTDRVNAGEPQS